MKALKELRRDPSIVILSADKDCATIILDTMDYDNKILSIVGDQNTYKTLKADPTEEDGCFLVISNEARKTVFQSLLSPTQLLR